MPHQICHAHCPKGGWGWLWYVALAAAVAVACYFAVKAAVAWLAAHWLITGLVAWLLALGGFGVVYKARERGRAGLPNPARPIPQGAPGPRRSQGGSAPRLHSPEQRRGQ